MAIYWREARDQSGRGMRMGARQSGRALYSRCFRSDEQGKRTAVRKIEPHSLNGQPAPARSHRIRVLAKHAEAQSPQSNPQHHTANIRQKLTELVDHLRQDTTRVSDPKAQAMFETTAEVLIGLRKAFEDYERRDEPAWRKAS